MMRRSFGGGAGGRGMGSGGMLKTVHRAVRAGMGGGGDNFSHTAAKSSNKHMNQKSRKSDKSSSPSSQMKLSSSSSSSFGNPFSAVEPTWVNEDFDWECVDGSEDERGGGGGGLGGFYNSDYYDFVFDAAPSNDEVQFAVSSLQQVLEPPTFSQFIKDRIAYDSDSSVVDKTICSSHSPKNGSESDWMEPSMQLCHSRLLSTPGTDMVYDAFHMLQNEPNIQRMVISLSSDKAVWDAVLSNEVVRELRESFNQDDKSVSEKAVEVSNDSNAALDILSWVFVNTRARVMEIIEKITNLVNVLFQPGSEDQADEGAAADPFNDKLRSSFLLTIFVLLIVVVGRSNRG